MAVDDCFDLGDLAIHDLQPHGKQVGKGELVIFRERNKARDATRLRVGNVVAILPQRVECHPQCLAQWDLRTVLGITVVRRRRDE